MNPRWLIPIVALGLGYTIPHWFRNQPFPPASAGTVPSGQNSLPPDASSSPNSAPGAPQAKHPYDASEITKILAYPSSLHRFGSLRRYFRNLAVADFPRALEDLQARPDIEVNALWALMQGWANANPEDALQHARSSAGPQRDKLLMAVITTWGEQNLVQAREAMAKLDEHDRQIASKAVDQFEDYQKKISAPSAPAESSGLSNREIFWKNVTFTQGATSRNSLAIEAYSKWVKEDPEGAAREIANSDLANQASSVSPIYFAWKERDPAKAEAYLNSLPENQRTKIQVQLLQNLADTNFASARAFVESTKDPLHRSFFTDTLAVHVFDSNPHAATELLQGIPEEARTAYYPGGAVHKWFEKDPEAAAAWLTSDPVFWKTYSNPENGRFFNGSDILRPWMDRDPIAVANFAARMAPHELPELMSDLGKIWTLRDPAGACAWAAKLPPDSPAHAEALKQFVYLWAEHDVKASTNFLNSLPAGPGKTGAAEGFTFSVIDDDPDAALAWVRVIPDEQKRLDVLGRAWRTWRSKNSAAATEWLKNNQGLTEQEREALGGL